MPDETEIHPRPTEVQLLREDVRKSNHRAAMMADLVCDILKELSAKGVRLSAGLAERAAPYAPR